MKPNFDILPPFYHGYVNNIKEKEVISALKNSRAECLALFRTIPEIKAEFRYAEDKWTVKELINHIIDAERVFAYRALSFARNDASELPGFEENDWARESNANNRTLNSIILEYEHVKQSTIDLFESFSEEALAKKGTANGAIFNVANIGYVIAGHETHHRNILNERYL